MVADLERQLEEAAALAKEDEVAPDGTYVVKKGDYLDKIINQTVGSSPLRRNIFTPGLCTGEPACLHAF